MSGVDLELCDDVDAISHDLKSPLEVISLDVMVVQERLPPDAPSELRRCLARIEHNVHYIDRLIHDLLDVSAYEADRLELSMERIELHAVLESVLERAVREHDRSRVVIEPRPPTFVIGDSLRLERVVANLVSNALKYSASTCDIRLRVERDGDKARVEVIDRGPGLTAEQCQLLFERYRRVTSQGLHRGHGLGLYVSRRIVEAHGGSIGVESRVGCGSRFYFVLDAVDAQLDPASRSSRDTEDDCRDDGLRIQESLESTL